LQPLVAGQGARMQISELIQDALSRVRDGVHGVLEGVSEAALTYRPDTRANTVAWLVWHLTRVQDDHLAEAGGAEQAWVTGGWYERFALPFDRGATGYGQSAEDVAAVRVSADLLRGYHDAVHAASSAWVAGLDEAALDRVVDEQWDPPVTLGVRLVSVLSDDLQHVGQAAYLRGLADRS
jgi:uncharacterized damage-inducible protein DinB